MTTRTQVSDPVIGSSPPVAVEVLVEVVTDSPVDVVPLGVSCVVVVPVLADGDGTVVVGGAVVVVVDDVSVPVSSPPAPGTFS
jgi:hypothetical protein